MIHAMHSVRAAAVAIVFAALFGFAADGALAGQQRQAPRGSIIPSRLQKVQKGDWALVLTGEGLLKETATDIVSVEADPENEIEALYMVEYTLEKFDAETGKPLEKPINVARAIEHEQEENAEILKAMKGKPSRKKVKLDGKTIDVVVVPQAEEDGIIIEHWFSDEVGIDGRVLMLVTGGHEEMEPYKSLEVLAFGDAKSPLNLKRYLQKKQ